MLNYCRQRTSRPRVARLIVADRAARDRRGPREDPASLVAAAYVPGDAVGHRDRARGTPAPDAVWLPLTVLLVIVRCPR